MIVINLIKCDLTLVAFGYAASIPGVTVSESIIIETPIRAIGSYFYRSTENTEVHFQFSVKYFAFQFVYGFF